MSHPCPLKPLFLCLRDRVEVTRETSLRIDADRISVAFVQTAVRLGSKLHVNGPLILFTSPLKVQALF